MNNKYLLFDRINRLDESFIYPIKELDERKHYSRKLNEGKSAGIFSKLSEVFLEYNIHSGNVKEDQRFLNEFISLMEYDDFDPFAHLMINDKIDEKSDCVLSITAKNAKLNHPYFALPAGYTCPGADACKTLTPRNRSKIDDKLVQDFGDIRCYGSSEEARYPNTQKTRWSNKDLLGKFDKSGKIDLLLNSLKHFEKKHNKLTLFRVHESGDFYSQEYFDAWMEVANQRSDVLFYAYTKSLSFWVARLSSIPKNFKFVASVGGLEDHLIDEYNLRYAVVVQTPEEAAKLRLPIDIDDSLAYGSDGNFAVLIHGTQKAGTEASKNAYKNRKIIKKYKK